MKNQLIILIAVILNYTIIYGQNIDFIRLGNKIQPLLGRNFFEKSQTGITNQNKILGILGQESQWLGVKSRQSLDLILFFKDKNQYTSFSYSSPSDSYLSSASSYSSSSASSDCSSFSASSSSSSSASSSASSSPFHYY